MADIFAVIADPTRRDLLGVLLERRDAYPGDAGSGGSGVGFGSDGDAIVGDISVGEIVTALGLSQPTVSKHLRVLRDAGLVHVREVGQHRYYSVDSGPLGEMSDWLLRFVAPKTEPRALVAAAARTSPVGVPAPLRRAAENLPDATDVGATLGRAVAGARNRILDPAKKRLGHRE